MSLHLCLVMSTRFLSVRYKLVVFFLLTLRLSPLPKQATTTLLVLCQYAGCCKYQSKKRGKIRNQHNQAPRLTQDINGKVITSQLDVTNESKELSPFSAGDHKASTNRRA